LHTSALLSLALTSAAILALGVARLTGPCCVNILGKIIALSHASTAALEIAASDTLTRCGALAAADAFSSAGETGAVGGREVSVGTGRHAHALVLKVQASCALGGKRARTAGRSTLGRAGQTLARAVGHVLKQRVAAGNACGAAAKSLTGRAVDDGGLTLGRRGTKACIALGITGHAGARAVGKSGHWATRHASIAELKVAARSAIGWRPTRAGISTLRRAWAARRVVRVEADRAGAHANVVQGHRGTLGALRGQRTAAAANAERRARLAVPICVNVLC
jgi:hypothetical protein